MILKLKFTKFFLVAGTLALPFYVFPSGSLQPYHLLLAIFAILVLVRCGFPTTLWLRLLLLTALHVSVVESIYVMLGGDPSALLNALFLIYNIVIVSALYTYVRQQGVAPVVFGVFGAGVIAFIIVSIIGVDLKELSGGRATGGFNNPNQLGFFSVCLLSMGYILYKTENLKYIPFLIVLAISIWLSILSLSKAAMLANASVIVLASRPRGSKVSLYAWLICAGFGLAFIAWSIFQGGLDDYIFMKRIYGIAAENDSSLEARGYFALAGANGLQIIFGLGSENVVHLIGHEVHSTFGSIVNNYGIVGLLLFTGAIVVWTKKIWLRYGAISVWCVVGPPILYGITHNGTRFTFFWILFATSLALVSRPQDIRRRKLREIPRLAPPNRLGVR